MKRMIDMGTAKQQAYIKAIYSKVTYAVYYNHVTERYSVRQYSKTYPIKEELVFITQGKEN